MKKSCFGFTLIELLVVIAIIGILAAILLPVLGSAQRRANIAESKTVLKQISQALKGYESDQGIYPPEAGGTNGPGTNLGSTPKTFQYFDGSLVHYLDGDTNTGNSTSRIQYFAFKDQYISGTNKEIYTDRFGGAYWYHNFQKDNLTGKASSSGNPAHPWETASLFKDAQIYSQIDYPETGTNRDTAYDPSSSGANISSNLKWITNYTD